MLPIRVSEPRRRARFVQRTFDPAVVCPAGQPVYETAKGSGVRCGVEQATLVALTDPQSIEVFCCGNYRLCTSWQAQREWAEEGRLTALLERDRDEQRERRERFEDYLERGETEVTYFEAPE